MSLFCSQNIILLSVIGGKLGRQLLVLDMVLPVPFHKTVCCWITIVAQPHPTLSTEPSGFSSKLGGRVECALSPLMPVRVLLVLLPDRKVTVWQGADDGTTTTSPTTTGVVSNQLLC